MVVGAGEGRSLASLGRPRDILRCNVRLHAPIPNHMQLVRISALSTNTPLVTACHWTIYLSLPVIAGKSERHTKFAGKSKIAEVVVVVGASYPAGSLAKNP